MKFFLLASLLSISVKTFSQVAFAKKYFEKASWISSCEAANDGIMVSYSLYFDTCACSNYFVMRCNELGDSLWTKKTDYPTHIFKGKDEGYFTARADNFTKVDSVLNPQWEFNIYLLEDNIYDVAQTPDSGYFLLGLKDTINFGNPSINHLYKLDKNGNELWEKYFYGDYRVNKIEATSDNGAVIYSSISDSTGSSRLMLLRVNANGDSLWSKTYEDLRGASLSNPMVTFSSGEIGFIALNDSYKPVLIKTDPLGNILNKDSVLGNSTLFLNLHLGHDGSLLAIGVNNSQADQDIQLLIREYNPDFILNQPIGDHTDEDGLYIYQTSDSGYYMVAQRDSSGKHEILLLRSSPGHDFHYSVPGIDSESGIMIYPNPSTSEFIIRSDAGSRHTHFRIYNVVGEEVYSDSMRGNQSSETTIDCRLFSRGIYFVQITDGANQVIKKLVIQ